MSTSSTEKATTTSSPWSVQQPYLQQAFSDAAGAKSTANANTYTGNQVAQFTPDQLATFQKMIGYGGSSSIPQQTADKGAAVSDMGMSALSKAMNGLTGFNPSGGTQSNIDAATAYANNPAADGMIQAAMRDSNRVVSEVALPQLARSNAMSGNTMSSKSALSEGVIARGLADKTADTSANIRGNLFNTGLQLAESGRTADNSAILDALKSSASAGSGAISTGLGAMGDSITQQGGLFDIANQGGSGQQSAAQAALDDPKAMSEYANSNAWKNLQNFYNIIGGQNWGGTKQEDKTSNPSIWNVMGGLLSSSGSLVRGIRGDSSK